ncbi:MAG: hypothetical protein KIS85_07090 [Anaerolineales bacterium]|nr:hypothetical protein [Anaerolineales bacterium]
MFIAYLFLVSFASLFLFYHAGVEGITGMMQGAASGNLAAVLLAPRTALVVGLVWAFHWMMLSPRRRKTTKTELQLMQILLLAVSGILVTSLLVEATNFVDQLGNLLLGRGGTDGWQVAGLGGRGAFALTLWLYHLRLFREVSKA